MDTVAEKDGIIAGLRQELEKAKEREALHEDSRQAMLFLLEDLNATTEAVIRAGKEWETTFDSITDPIFIHDKDFKIIRANRAYMLLAGKKYKEIIGKPYYRIFPVMDRAFDACLRNENETADATPEPNKKEEILHAGNKLFKARRYPIRDPLGKYLYVIHLLEDVTDAKKAEARLREEQNVTASLLAMAEANASTKDLGKLMEAVVKSVAVVLGSDVCLSYLMDRRTAKFEPSRAFGLSKDEQPVFRTEQVDEKAALIKEPLERKKAVVTHSESGKGPAGPAPFAWLGAFATTLAIPLFNKRWLGVIIALYRERRAFSDAEGGIIKGITYQVSSAVAEAVLYRESMERAVELSHQIETMKIMQEIDKDILSSFSSDEILNTVVRLLSRLVPCDMATVAVVDRERGGFIYRAGFGSDLPEKAFTPFASTSATEVVDTGMPQFISNMRDVKDLLPLERMLIGAGFVSHLMTPLVVKGETVAVLSISSKKAGVFARDILEDIDKLAAQISVALENARLVTDLQDLFISTVKTLSNTIDAKSPWTMGHSERVTAMALSMARKMDFTEQGLKTLELAGLLHDIGKLATYESILNKPGKLTEEELGLMRQHPAKGAAIIEPITQLKEIVPAIRHHHENYDGTGYPDGLKGEDIPLMARILSVADSVDAMTADRPYRKGRDMDAIIAELKRCSGTQFDPDAVAMFLASLGESGKT